MFLDEILHSASVSFASSVPLMKQHMYVSGVVKTSVEYSENRRESIHIIWDERSSKISQWSIIILFWGRRVIGISGSLIWSETLMELIFNPCGEFRWSAEGPVSQIHSPHLHAEAPRIFSDLLRFIQMLKREWGAESNGKLPHLFIPSKTATLVPAFAVKDLPLGRTHWWQI